MSPQVFCKSAWVVTIVAFVKTHENLLIFLASLRGSYKNAFVVAMVAFVKTHENLLIFLASLQGSYKSAFVVAMVAFVNTVCESSSCLQKFMCSHNRCICKANVFGRTT